MRPRSRPNSRPRRRPAAGDNLAAGSADPSDAPDGLSPIGHNWAPGVIEVEVRFYNSLAAVGRTHGAGSNGARRFLTLPAGSTVTDAIRELNLPLRDIYVVFRNGHNLLRNRGHGIEIDTGHGLEHGDVLAFSGPVPFSWGYGAPVV